MKKYFVLFFTLLSILTFSSCSTYNFENVDIFMLSVLHEVGHSQTLEDIIDDDLYEQEQRVKETLDGSKKVDNYIYFSLPSEMAATLWAIDFIIENSEELSVLWTELQNHIMQFYKDNGVEIDD